MASERLKSRPTPLGQPRVRRRRKKKQEQQQVAHLPPKQMGPSHRKRARRREEAERKRGGSRSKRCCLVVVLFSLVLHLPTCLANLEQTSYLEANKGSNATTTTAQGNSRLDDYEAYLARLEETEGEEQAGEARFLPEASTQVMKGAVLAATERPSLAETDNGAIANLLGHIDRQWKSAELVLVIVISAVLNLVTIIGNIMVLISFKMDRSLQTVSNYFLLSLALADLLIGLISMPLYTLYLLLNYWPLGPLMCDIWLAIDYLNSNAAVLNMLIISFDRYFSVTRPLTYRAKRTTKHACLLISCAWILSLTIWTPAIFTYPYFKGRTVQGTDKCEIEFVKANTYLTFVTAILAFYIPVIIMIYLYWRIWLETKKRYRDLTTLFLVSGVGAAAPVRATRPPHGMHAAKQLANRAVGRKQRPFNASYQPALPATVKPLTKPLEQPRREVQAEEPSEKQQVVEGAKSDNRDQQVALGETKIVDKLVEQKQQQSKCHCCRRSRCTKVKKSPKANSSRYGGCPTAIESRLVECQPDACSMLANEPTSVCVVRGGFQDCCPELLANKERRHRRHHCHSQSHGHTHSHNHNGHHNHHHKHHNHQQHRHHKHLHNLRGAKLGLEQTHEQSARSGDCHARRLANSEWLGSSGGRTAMEGKQAAGQSEQQSLSPGRVSLLSSSYQLLSSNTRSLGGSIMRKVHPTNNSQRPSSCGDGDGVKAEAEAERGAQGSSLMGAAHEQQRQQKQLHRQTGQPLAGEMCRQTADELVSDKWSSLSCGELARADRSPLCSGGQQLVKRVVDVGTSPIQFPGSPKSGCDDERDYETRIVTAGDRFAFEPANFKFSPVRGGNCGRNTYTSAKTSCVTCKLCQLSATRLQHQFQAQTISRNSNNNRCCSAAVLAHDAHCRLCNPQVARESRSRQTDECKACAKSARKAQTKQVEGVKQDKQVTVTNLPILSALTSQSGQLVSSELPEETNGRGTKEKQVCGEKRQKLSQRLTFCDILVENNSSPARQKELRFDETSVRSNETTNADTSTGSRSLNRFKSFIWPFGRSKDEVKAASFLNRLCCFGEARLRAKRSSGNSSSANSASGKRVAQDESSREQTGSKTGSSTSSYSSHHPIQPKSERKAAKTLSTLLLVFIVTWLPYNVLVLIKTLSGGEDLVPEKIWNFSYYLCYINSTINPLCYALCNAQFRRTYMRILKCKLSNEHNSTRRLVPIQPSNTWSKDLRLNSDSNSNNPSTLIAGNCAVGGQTSCISTSRQLA